MKVALGVDIGGTKTAIGLVDQVGNILHKEVIPTEIDWKPERMCDKIMETIRMLIAEAEVNIDTLVGIGFGVPGPIDRERGTIVCPPNLPTWHGFQMRSYLAKKLSLSILIENDANVATLAEKWLGAGKENDSFVYLTISTGVGGGFYINGDVLWGKYGNAAEVGFMVMNAAGETIEDLASGTAIVKRASALTGETLTTAEVFRRYQQGDAVMVPLVEETFRHLGIFCTNLIAFAEPEKIIIGGGVSNVGEPLFQALRNHVQQHACTPFGKKTEIVPASLRSDTGLIGAAALFLLER
ncbi:ROK family protein [Laceyella putida]|uniref:ROK family protein n=1 Tax=Laceyella putida TaxID=110101 RepID=A0ABW2RLY4_9BACL